MDTDRIKEIYDKRFRGNPDAMEEYVIRQLQEAVFCPTKPIKIPEGYEVTIHYDESGRIIDMTFERKH